MNRSPFKRNGKSNRAKRSRQLRSVLFLLLGISLIQYVTTGAINWPGELFRTVKESVGDYAARPDAGWRRAIDELEDVGAAREGDPIPDFDLTGRVVRISDGDTVSILDNNNTQHKVRLFGIDTPERDQPHGKTAKKALSDLVHEKNVGVVVVDTDTYRRKVGTLYREGTNINVTMVSNGHAWWYRHYAPHEHRLDMAEQRARTQGLGLWANPNPVPPWDWRRAQR